MKCLDVDVVLDKPTDTLTLMPFGCVHADNPGFREPLWRQYLTELQNTPNAYGIGLGDYWDAWRTHARTHLKSYVEDDNSFEALDSMVREKAQGFHRKYLVPVQNRILGLSEGNHYHEFQSGMTDTQYLCDLMKVPYLDKPCFMRLTVKCRYGSGELRTMKVFRILIHHGDWSAGNGRIGSDMMSIENKSLGFEFDIYIFAHTHRCYGVHIPTLTIPIVGKLEPLERPRAFMRAGCFMAGFHPGCHKSYAHKKLLAPTELGYCRLHINFYRQYEAERWDRTRQRDDDGLLKRGSGTGNWRHKFEVRF